MKLTKIQNKKVKLPNNIGLINLKNAVMFEREEREYVLHNPTRRSKSDFLQNATRRRFWERKNIVVFVRSSSVKFFFLVVKVSTFQSGQNGYVTRYLNRIKMTIMPSVTCVYVFRGVRAGGVW